MDSVQQAIWEMMEAAGRTVQSFGLNRLYGQIYILIYLRGEPLSLDDLAGELGVSKASVSVACRQMETWGALKKLWKKGDRRDYYAAEEDVGAILKNGLLASVMKKLASAEVQIGRCIQLLDGDENADERAGNVRVRLEKAEQVRSRVVELLKNPVVSELL